MAFAQAPVRDPPARLDVVSAPLPVRDEIAPPLRVRCMAGHVIDQATPLAKTGDVVVPRSIAHAAGVRCRLHRRAPLGVLTGFDPEPITPIRGV